jgi:hypothetical protein
VQISSTAACLRIAFDAGRRQEAEIGPVPGAGELPGLDLALADWESDDFAFYDFDRRVEALAAAAPGGCFEIRLSGDPDRLLPAARQLAIRCQRLNGWRNDAAAAAGKLFDRAIAAHRRLHDLARPRLRSVMADYAHALDTWQWLLRLDPEAGLAPQLAALFHDVERLVCEAGTRGEHRAPSTGYQAFKDEHARRGAMLTDELLAELGIDLATRVRAYRLIAGHERPSAASSPSGAELALLNDADALSFFSLNSAGYLGCFGTELTARKVAYTAARMRPSARARLRDLRLRATVARLLEAELASPSATARAPSAPAAAAPPSRAQLTIMPGTAAGAARDGKPLPQAASPALVPRAVTQPFFAGEPSRATALARSRLAAGLAGGAGIARTRVSALLARAAALGTLSPQPSRARGSTLGPRSLVSTGAIATAAAATTVAGCAGIGSSAAAATGAGAARPAGSLRRGHTKA